MVGHGIHDIHRIEMRHTERWAMTGNLFYLTARPQSFFVGYRPMCHTSTEGIISQIPSTRPSRPAAPGNQPILSASSEPCACPIAWYVLVPRTSRGAS